MKIAKKVLVLVVALAMVACCASVAFASSAQVKDDVVTLTVAVKAEALESADIVVTFDPAVVSYKETKAGAAAPTMCIGNKTSDNAVTVGLLFLESYTGNDSLAVLTFEVVDAEATKTSFTIEGLGDKAATVNVTIKEEETTKAPVETTTNAPVETTTKAPVAEKETTTKAPVADKETTTKAPVVDKETTTKAPSTSTEANPNTGDKPAGDNMALAAAFGVVALAGAAFVFTKKRK